MLSYNHLSECVPVAKKSIFASGESSSCTMYYFSQCKVSVLSLEYQGTRPVVMGYSAHMWRKCNTEIAFSGSLGQADPYNEQLQRLNIGRNQSILETFAFAFTCTDLTIYCCRRDVENVTIRGEEGPRREDEDRHDEGDGDYGSSGITENGQVTY